MLVSIIKLALGFVNYLSAFCVSFLVKYLKMIYYHKHNTTQLRNSRIVEYKIKCGLAKLSSS